MHILRGGMVTVACVALGCVRLVAPDDSNSTFDAAVAALEVTSLEVDSVLVSPSADAVWGFGGETLRIVGTGFDSALAEARLEGTPLRRAQEPGGTLAPDGGGMMSTTPDGGSVLLVALPPNRMEGHVVVVQGGRAGTSAQVVKVLGAGHPERVEYVGSTDPQFSIVRAGTQPLYCAFLEGCGEKDAMPGQLAVAFSVASGQFFAPVFHVAVLGMFGANVQLGQLGGGDLATNVTQLWPFDPAARRGPGSSVGVAFHRFFYNAEGEGSEVRALTLPGLRDGGVLQNAQPVVLPLAPYAALTIAENGTDVVPLVNGFPLPEQRSDGGVLPWSLPNAVGANQPGRLVQDTVPPRLLWLECPAVDGGHQITMRQVSWAEAWRDGGPPVSSTTHLVPDMPPEGTTACDLLGGTKAAACRALRETEELETCVQDQGDGGCCQLRNHLARCRGDQGDGGCNHQLLSLETCALVPACASALDACATSGNCGSCNASPVCSAVVACFNNPDCAAALACAEIPGCGAGAPEDEAADCQAIMDCQTADDCRGHLACDKGGCDSVNQCLAAMCRPPEVDDGGSRFANIGYLTPLDDTRRLFTRNKEADAYLPSTAPACVVDTTTGLPTLLLEDALTTASATDVGNPPRVISVLGASRVLVVQDLDTFTFGLAAARARYQQLLSANLAGFVFAIPETGPRVDVLNRDGVPVANYHVLGNARAAFPMPAEDGRILSFYESHVVMADSAGAVTGMQFFVPQMYVAEPPPPTGGLPTAIWGVVRDDNEAYVLIRLALDLGPPVAGSLVLGTAEPRGIIPSEELDAWAFVKVMGVYQDTLYVLRCSDVSCEDPDITLVTAGAPGRDLAFEPILDWQALTFLAIDTRAGVALSSQDRPNESNVAVLVNLSAGAGAGGIMTVQPREQQGTVSPIKAVPASGGGFVMTAVVNVGTEYRKVVGWVTPGPAGLLDILAPMESVDTAIAVSPDGRRVYVGSLGQLVELTITVDRSVTPSRYVVTSTRVIPLEGRPDSIALDAEGTRLVYTDQEAQTIGLLE